MEINVLIILSQVVNLEVEIEQILGGFAQDHSILNTTKCEFLSYFQCFCVEIAGSTQTLLFVSSFKEGHIYPSTSSLSEV